MRNKTKVLVAEYDVVNLQSFPRKMTDGVLMTQQRAKIVVKLKELAMLRRLIRASD